MDNNGLLTTEQLDLRNKEIIQRIDKLYLICNMLFGKSKTKEIRSLEVIKESYVQMYHKIIETGEYEKYKDVKI